MKIKKGDNVLIIAGKDKGKTGKVFKSMPKDEKVLIEGVNIVTKSVRAKKQGEKGQFVKIPLPIDVSNVKFICPKCGKATRVGYKVENDNKSRICKKCSQQV